MHIYFNSGEVVIRRAGKREVDDISRTKFYCTTILAEENARKDSERKKEEIVLIAYSYSLH